MKELRCLVCFLLAIIAITLSGCKSKEKISTRVMEPEKIDTLSESESIEVMFPSDVLYVIAKEFEAIHDSATAKFNTDCAKELRDSSFSASDYFEMRLIDLYPDKSGKGILSEINGTTVYKNRWKEKQFTLPENEIHFLSSEETREKNVFYSFHSVEDEMEFLQMTAAEKERYQELNRLAIAEKFADTIDFNNMNRADTIPFDLLQENKKFFLEENVFLSYLLFVHGGSYLIYRVKMSKERAEHEAYRYYQDQISCGKKGDAFKHIYVNMMLRRYLTESISFLVMDVFWENWNTNSPCDKHMDLHNNYVGRRTQYSQLKANSNNWQTWGSNVYNFVENSTNAEEKEWNKSMIEYSIEMDVGNVSKQKYIFWNKTQDCE